MTLLRFAGLIRPVGMPRTNTQVAMVWNQYLYLVYAGSILALWKAQNILTMDFHSKLLDRFLDPSVLHEPVTRASRDPRQRLNGIGFA